MKFRDRIKRFDRVPASELAKNPKNWRTHPDSQRRVLRDLLDEIGIVDTAIAYETPDGLVLIDGHLRTEEITDTPIPVLVLDVTEAEAEKVLVTLDPLAAMAGIDMAQFEGLSASVETDSEAIQSMLDDLAKEASIKVESEIIEDEIPEPPADPITKPGDLWLLGDHRLLCGDSTKAEDVQRLMAGAKAAMMVTDPPYGVDYDPSWRAEVNDDGPNSNRAVGKVANDDRADWTETWRLFDGDVAYVWHAGRYSPVVAGNLEATGLEVRYLIIWAKQRHTFGRGHYHHQHEPCWFVVRKGATASWAGDRTQTTLWQIDNNRHNDTGHGTQKPVECMARPIRNHEAGLIYDPFLGSGTTLIAAEQLGRKCYGIEISPAYCDIAVKRWETLTGQKARLA